WSSDTAEDRLEHLALPPNTHLVEVGYAAIAFTLRDRLQLQHQLVGVDPAPVPTGSTGRAIYTGLGPGEHRLLISDGRDPDGMDHPLRELLIRIEPTFLQRGWVRASLFAALLLLVIGLVQWRLKLLRERERMRTEHIKQVAEVEMMALRAQMNPHFLFNCLNAINRYIVRNDREAASGYLTKFSRLMRNVLQNSKEQLVTLKDELDTLRLYVELEQLRFNERFDFDLRVELEDDPAEIRVPPMLLQPYVENAIWHGL
ncbi:MAG: sensor histidine kinase, partial [Flavobacteriales bacterium]|nr:sensor histidine kinase [Flavobacteriales bacterium]